MTSSNKSLAGLALLILIILVPSIAEAGARPSNAALELQRAAVWFAPSASPQRQVAADRTDPAQSADPEATARLAVAQSVSATNLVLDESLEPLGQATRPSEDALMVYRFGQRVDDIPVFGSKLSVLADCNENLRAVTGAYAVPAEGARWPKAALTQKQALRSALAALDAPADRIAMSRQDQSGEFKQFGLTSVLEFRFGHPVRIRPVWYPLENALHPAYQVELTGSRPGQLRPIAKSILISAIDGRELRRDNQIYDMRRRQDACGESCPRHNFGYRVLASRRNVPYTDPYGFTSPHPTGVADASLPTQPAPMHLLRLNHSGISTGDPWLPSDATDTAGNNVDAFFKAIPEEDGVYTQDIFQDWPYSYDPDSDDHRAPLSAPWTFDYAYDVDRAPQDYFQLPGQPVQPVPFDDAQFNARIVQPFFAANWLHDLFYDLGFDEVAGNMQMDNYGRGGLDGDPLKIVAASNNTFVFAPDDGVSPVMMLGHNNFGLSNRDVSALDFGVMVHEWGHVLIYRLSGMTGGAPGQQGALHEGFADFLAMFLMVQPGHRDAAPNTGDFHGAYPVGAYWNLDYYNPFEDLPPAGSPELPDNAYYHGIRRFPFSASFDINPLTFGHLSPDNPLPEGFEPFDWKWRSLQSYEIHTAGEVWASALWHCARNILAASSDRGFRNAHRRFLASVVAALKMLPMDATYTEARDVVLMAVRATDEQEYLDCRAGFAQRGMGAGAVSPPRDSVEFREVVEDFTDEDPPALQGSSRHAMVADLPPTDK